MSSKDSTTVARLSIIRRMGGALCASVAAALMLAGAASAGGPNAWSAVASLGTARGFPVAGLLPSGNVIVAGGSDATAMALSSSEIFNAGIDAWSAGPAMTTARAEAAAVTLSNGDLLVAGGMSADTDASGLSSAEVYDQAANSFAPAANAMSSARILPAAALLGNGDALIIGGEDATGAALATADIYDPSDNQFVAAAPMSTARILPMAVTLTDGDVLVAGGIPALSGSPLASAEVYHPATNTWTAVSNTMSSPRFGGEVAPLPGGRELLAGGASSTISAATTATTDIYSPTTNAFAAGPSMATARLLFGMVALNDGRVLAFGGATETGSTVSFTSSAELYDPTANAWSPTAGLPVAVGETTATLLRTGQVLEAGGIPALAAVSGQAALYAPATVASAPIAVSAAAGNGSALVSFAPPATDGGAPITSYTVTASSGQTASTPDARTFATVTGLTNGAPVTFTVTATNAEGTSAASAPSNPVTPAAPPVTPSATTTTTTTTTPTTTTPDTAPTLTLSGLPKQLSLKQFLKGLRFSVAPSKAAALQATLLATVKQATIASAFDLTLATKALAASATKRTITLTPSKKLVGHPRTAKVELVVVAIDAAGSRSTTTRTVTIHSWYTRPQILRVSAASGRA